MQRFGLFNCKIPAIQLECPYLLKDRRRTMKTPTLLAILVIGASLASPALADPESQGRVKVQMDNTRSTSTSTSTADELQGIVVLCANDDKSCTQKSATENPKKSRQHNQSDIEFIRERAN
jgi:hypothetical protein